jgi:hypothetical protein
MPDVAVVPDGQPLSQVERVVDTFVAPKKTFTDILRSANWTLPFVIIFLVGIVFSVAVDKKVGFATVAQQQIEKNKMAADRIDSLPPDQKAAQYEAAAKRTKVTAYVYVVPILIFLRRLSRCCGGPR